MSFVILELKQNDSSCLLSLHHVPVDHRLDCSELLVRLFECNAHRSTSTFSVSHALSDSHAFSMVLDFVASQG